MSIFTKKTTGTLAVVASTLKQQSVNALDTFNRVLQELKDINEQSSARQVELYAESAKIDLEIKELADVNDKNIKIIANIEKILS